MDRLKRLVRVILESAAIMIAVMEVVTLMGMMMSWSAPLIDYVVLIGGTCAGLLRIAELYAAPHRRRILYFLRGSANGQRGEAG